MKSLKMDFMNRTKLPFNFINILQSIRKIPTFILLGAKYWMNGHINLNFSIFVFCFYLFVGAFVFVCENQLKLRFMRRLHAKCINLVWPWMLLRAFRIKTTMVRLSSWSIQWKKRSISFMNLVIRCESNSNEQTVRTDEWCAMCIAIIVANKRPLLWRVFLLLFLSKILSGTIHVY